MSKKSYVVKTPVEHDAERFEIGTEIALTEKQAAPLLAVKAIVDPDDLDGDGAPDLVEARAAKSRKRKAKAGEGEGEGDGE
jgi:hypothetical protein